MNGQFRSGILHCALVFCAVRVGLGLIALAGVALLPDLSAVQGRTDLGLSPSIPGPVDVPGWPAPHVTPGVHNAFTSWERLDALWFLRIADGGYSEDDASAAFFPLYPMAIRTVSVLVGGHPLAAGILVSNLAFLGVLIMLYILGRTELSEEAARRAVTYAAFFPTAFFFLAPYSESLFLLLVLTAFWAARRSRWEIAGLAGAAAALTRNVGVLLVLPLAAEALLQARALPAWRWPLRGLAWSVAPVGGLLLYLGYWGMRSGDWLEPLHQQAHWQRELANPLGTAVQGTKLAFSYLGAYPGGYHLLDWVLFAFVLGAAAYAAIRFRASYGLFTWAGIVVPISSLFEGRPLIAFSRYALPLFPVYWAMSRWSERVKGLHGVLIGVSAALLGLMLLLFVNWYYII